MKYLKLLNITLIDKARNESLRERYTERINEIAGIFKQIR